MAECPEHVGELSPTPTPRAEHTSGSLCFCSCGLVHAEDDAGHGTAATTESCTSMSLPSAVENIDDGYDSEALIESILIEGADIRRVIKPKHMAMIKARLHQLKHELGMLESGEEFRELALKLMQQITRDLRVKKKKTMPLIRSTSDPTFEADVYSHLRRQPWQRASTGEHFRADSTLGMATAMATASAVQSDDYCQCFQQSEGLSVTSTPTPTPMRSALTDAFGSSSMRHSVSTEDMMHWSQTRRKRRLEKASAAFSLKKRETLPAVSGHFNPETDTGDYYDDTSTALEPGATMSAMDIPSPTGFERDGSGFSGYSSDCDDFYSSVLSATSERRRRHSSQSVASTRRGPVAEVLLGFCDYVPHSSSETDTSAAMASTTIGLLQDKTRASLPRGSSVPLLCSSVADWRPPGALSPALRMPESKQSMHDSDSVLSAATTLMGFSTTSTAHFSPCAIDSHTTDGWSPPPPKHKSLPTAKPKCHLSQLSDTVSQCSGLDSAPRKIGTEKTVEMRRVRKPLPNDEHFYIVLKRRPNDGCDAEASGSSEESPDLLLEYETLMGYPF